MRLKTLLIILFATLLPLTVWAQETVIIRGKIQTGASQGLPKEGVPVVLLKFVLDEQGQIQTTGPIARTQSDASGQFQFNDIPLEVKATYRLGSRFEGALVSSDLFSMSEEKKEYEVNVVVPTRTEAIEQLQLTRSSLFLEAESGTLWVTELWLVHNPTPDIIDSSNKPFTLNLPPNAIHFQPYSQEGISWEHAILGQQLQVFHEFSPGHSSLFFRYALSASFGFYTLHKVYPESLKLAMLFAPEDQLGVTAPEFTSDDPQLFGNRSFRSWKLEGSNLEPVTIRVNAIPIPQSTYRYLTIIMLVIFGVLVLGFIKVRKPAAV